ncbi:MAG: tRNA (adenosine(37)-N6)-dimethylallyltransferase MiaA [bacterium]
MGIIDRLPAALVLTGPTAIGKSAVALALAEKFPAEIISADSRQVYRYMDIGTAKSTSEERARVSHHFIDICDPDEAYSAGQFGREARTCVLEILQREKLPLIAGGSGLYLRALLQGLSGPLPSDRRLQEELKRRVRREGSAALHAELEQIDPLSAQHLHPNDVHRIVRALEVFYVKNISQRQLWKTAAVPAPFAYQIFILNLERKLLYERIDRRVEHMFACGLVEECRLLLDRGYSPEHTALRTVGYQEVIQYLRGELSYAEMVALVQRHSRQYAKRQLTWFRRIVDGIWLDLSATESAGAVADRIVEMMRR